MPLRKFFLNLNETPLAQIKENKMKNRKYFEIIGLLSVIGSLVFVGLEINQNTAAVRGATQQEISYQISEMYKIGVENDKIASIMSRSYQGLKKSELTETEFLQFWLFSMLGYRRVENIYLQYKNGFLADVTVDTISISLHIFFNSFTAVILKLLFLYFFTMREAFS